MTTRYGKSVEAIQWMKHFELDKAIEVTAEIAGKNSKRFGESHRLFLKTLRQAKAVL